MVFEILPAVGDAGTRAGLAGELMGALLGGPQELFDRALDVLVAAALEPVDGERNKRGFTEIGFWLPGVYHLDRERAEQIAHRMNRHELLERAEDAASGLDAEELARWYCFPWMHDDEWE